MNKKGVPQALCAQKREPGGGMLVRMIRIAALLFICIASSARADHPLLTEDTGVLGKGNWQFEFHGERARSRGDGTVTRSVSPAFVLGYGLNATMDVEAELTYSRDATDDGTSRTVEKGIQDTTLAWKWRFHESGPFSVLLRPNVTFPSGADERGLGGGRFSWGSDLVAAYESSPVTLLLHAAYQRNRNALGEREPLWHLSGALLWSLTDRIRLLLDHGRDTNPDPADSPRSRRTSYGVWYAVTGDFDLGIGVGTRATALERERSLMASMKLRW